MYNEPIELMRDCTPIEYSRSIPTYFPAKRFIRNSVQSVFLLLHIILRIHEQYSAMLYFQSTKIIYPIRAYAEKSERYKVLTNEPAILNLRAKSGVLFPRDYFSAFFTRLQELK